VHVLDIRLSKVVAFAVLVLLLVGIVYISYREHVSTWEEVEAPMHSITSHRVGLHEQGELVRARVVIDEDSVQYLAGRRVTVQMVDSENRASMEQGEGYVPVAEVEIDVRESDFPLLQANVGDIEYTAHRKDTYYLVFRNEDWRDIKLRVANGDALDWQFQVKAIAVILVVATLIIFAWAYGRVFDVNVRHALGLVRRLKGPGSRSAQEPRAPDLPSDEPMLEAED
jgi:hypothetical protein